MAQQQPTILNPSFENPYRLNAAFPAETRINRLSGNYINFNTSANTEVNVSYSAFYKSLSGSLGLSATYADDQKSGISLENFNVYYAYKFCIYQMSRDYLYVSAGTGIGTIYYQGQNISSRFSLDFSPGIIVYNPKYYGGIGFNHIPIINKIAESVLPVSQTFNVFAGVWLPVDNWKRVPENFLSPNIEYSSFSSTRTIALGAYYAWKWIMPGLFYEYSGKESGYFRTSLGLSMDNIRLHFLAAIPFQNPNYQNMTYEISAVVLFHNYIHGHGHWRSSDMYCPATW